VKLNHSAEYQVDRRRHRQLEVPIRAGLQDAQLHWLVDGETIPKQYHPSNYIH
jgi:hypothetical protein